MAAMRIPRTIGTLLVCVYLANAFAYAIAVPVYQAPDEPVHLSVMRYVRENARYPDARTDRLQPQIVQSLRDAEFSALRGLDARATEGAHRWRSLDEEHGGSPGQIISIAGHPPAYYVTFAPLEALTSSMSFPAQVLVLRLLTAILAAPAVWFTYATVRMLWPGRRDVAIASGAFVALLPQYAHVGGALSNDPLLASAFAATTYAAARIVLDGPHRRWLVAGAASSLLAAFTKAHGILAIGVFALGVVVSVRTHPGARTRVHAAALAAVLVPAAAAALWYGIRVAQGLPILPPDPRPVAPDTHAAGLVAFALGIAAPIFTVSFWGNFGWLAVRLEIGWYVLLDAIALGGIGGTAALAFRARRAAAGPPAVRHARVAAAAGGLATLAVIAGVVVVASWRTYQRTGFARGLQGRYLFPIVGVLAAVVAGGLLAGWPRRWRPAASAILPAALGAASIAGVWRVVRSFYGGNDLGMTMQNLGGFSPLSVAPWMIGALALLVAGGTVAAAAAAVAASREVAA